jgi:hypothetical protein
MAKRKSGLHKKISSIFDGVQITKENLQTSSGVNQEEERPQEVSPQIDSPASVQPVCETEENYLPSYADPIVPPPVLPQDIDDSNDEIQAETDSPVEPSYELETGYQQPADPVETPSAPTSQDYNYNTPVEPAFENKPEDEPEIREEYQPVKSEKPVFKVPSQKTSQKTTGTVGNRKNKVMVFLMVSLSVVMAFILMNAFDFSFSSPSNTSASTLPEEQPESVIASSVDIGWEKPALISELNRNPMTPVTVPDIVEEQDSGLQESNPSELPEFSIVGIVYSEEKASAIIDQDIVHEGDVIEGVTIMMIDRTYVEFEKNGVKWKQKVK